MKTNDKLIIEKQKELINHLSEAFKFQADDNLVKYHIKWANLLKELSVLESEQTEEGKAERISLMEQYGITESDVDAAVKIYCMGKDLNPSLQSSEHENNKTAESILNRKRLLINDGIEWVPLNSALQAMEEYAAQSQPEKVTDEDIEKAADKISFGGNNKFGKTNRLNWIFGAKALRDNKIK